jgi:hypothetical protein
MNISKSDGIKWGPFTLRVPFIHITFRSAEFIQGLVISGATAFAAAPIAMAMGLTFNEAIALSLISGTLISAGPLIFGEPMAPGWITPAVPIVIGALAAAGLYGAAPCQTINNNLVCAYNPQTFQFMAAMCIEFTILVLVLGLTGWGKLLVEKIPNGLKAGIILGAALAAFNQVFITDFESKYMLQPVSMTVALVLCVITTFSNPFKNLGAKNKFFKFIGSLGLLPGFVVAGLIAFYLQEVTFDIQWGWQVPALGSLIEKTSPFFIGFPSIEMYKDAIPLVLIGYMLLFGDLVTGTEILKDAQKHRTDQILPIDLNRSHLSVGIRNLLGTIINPFFPTQGALWTGVHVVVADKWKQGPEAMPSIFDGIGSYYLMGIPFLYFTLPFVTLMEPLMGMALALTLVLTGFACAFVGMGIPKQNSEMATALIIAFLISFNTHSVELSVFNFSVELGPLWVSLLIGLFLSVVVDGSDQEESA